MIRRRRNIDQANQARILIANALVNLNGDNITTDGSGFVTAWLNQGTGGAAYDMDVVVGTLANSSVTTLNGNNAVLSTGSYGLESTAGQDIPAGATIFAVAKYNNATPSTNQNIFDPRSDADKRMQLYSRNASSDDFTVFEGGTEISLAGSYDTSPHVFTCQFNGDATSKLTVSGVGSVTGDAGPDEWDYGSLLMDRGGTSTMEGYVAELLVFDSALTETQVTAVQQYLASKYAL